MENILSFTSDRIIDIIVSSKSFERNTEEFKYMRLCACSENLMLGHTGLHLLRLTRPPDAERRLHPRLAPRERPAAVARVSLVPTHKGFVECGGLSSDDQKAHRMRGWISG
jgi:hypothetical protein